jgi:hypothetical protein
LDQPELICQTHDPGCWLLENNINHILGPHLIAKAFGLNWFFDMVSELLWSSGHEFESHHPHLFDKN